MLHNLRKLLRRILGPKGRGHCIDCNVRLTHNELRYYHAQCERCVADDMALLEDLQVPDEPAYVVTVHPQITGEDLR